ncbi:MAG: hypothetical protein OXR07_07830 [Nitrospira sp.]|nr:hypothetical protein [Nitrospira sp.]
MREFTATSSDTLPSNAHLIRLAESYTSPLNDALRAHREVRDTAREEGFLQPSEQALHNAKRPPIEMYGLSPRRFEMYPTPDSEIAIDAPDGQGRSVILLYDSESGALGSLDVVSVYQALHGKASSPEGVIPSVINIPSEFTVTSSDTLPSNAPLIHIAESYTSPLNDALRDLREVRDEAREEGFPQPSEQALQNAKRLLIEMYGISPRRFEVYPTPDSEIAIDAPDGQGRSVILLCDSEGGALCLVNMNGNHRRARYATTKTLPDGFVREALAGLQSQRTFSLWRSPTTLH